MNGKSTRTRSLIGDAAIKRLESSRVIIFGVGGVGGYVLEALARAGVGHITVVDSDTVSESNINRQLLATKATVGKKKVDAAKERVLDIGGVDIECIDAFYLPESAADFDLRRYDYIADCIDTVAAKLDIAQRAYELSIPIVSSMGTANKLDITKLRACDINDTSVCPLARVMRTELRKRGVKKLRVVYSEEKARVPMSDELDRNGRKVPASISYVPAAAGLLIAQEIILGLTKDLIPESTK